MAPIKRKITSTEEARSPRPKVLAVEDRPRKRPRQDTESTTVKCEKKKTTSDKAAHASRTPTKVSLLREEEPAFPRGGASVLTPLEHKQIKIEATRDVLFEQSSSKKRSAPESSSKKKSAPESSDEEHETRPASAPVRRGKKAKSAKKRRTDAEVEEASGIKIEGLSYARIAAGSIVLGQVARINTDDVELALPNNLTGYIPLTNVSKGLSDRLEAIADREDSEDEECGEKADGATREDDDVDLKKIFSLGQYLRAQVTSTSDDAATNGAAKGKRRIVLSVAPQQANSGLERADVVRNNILQAAVVSVEDHGLVMDLGLDDPSVRGFMSSKEVGYAVTYAEIEVGAVFLCLVTGLSANGKTVKLSADAQKAGNIKKSHFLADAPTIDAFLPGVAVEVLVTEVTHAGLAGQLMGSLDVTADLVHSGADTHSKDIEKRFKVGQKVKGRVICTFPMLEPRKVAISLLDHVLSLSPASSGKEKTSPTTALSLSTILPEAKVTKVHPGVGLFLDVGVAGVPGFVHISRISDSKVDNLSETTGPYKIGSVHAARVIGYNPIDGLFLVSMEERVLQQSFLRIEDISVGEVVKGTIERLVITEKGLAGVLVKLSEGISGLVPELHLADVKLSHPEKKFREGLTVKARVLSTDPAKRQLRLTLKKTLVNSEAPVLKSFDDVPSAAQCPGTIVSILPSGAIVQFYGPVRAFLPVSEMSEAFIRDPNEHFRVGQVVNVHALSVDAENRKMIVSCRNPTEMGAGQVKALQELPLGTIVSGKVAAKSSDDVVVQLTATGLRAILPLGHLTDGSEQKNLSALTKIRVGQILHGLVVLSKDEHKKTISISNKPSLVADAKAGSLVSSFDDVEEAEEVHGFVNNVTLTGIFVTFAGGVTGLVLKRDIPDEALRLPDFGVRRLQSISATVLSVDHGQRRFLLSMTADAKVTAGTVASKNTGVPSLEQALSRPVDSTIKALEDFSLGKRTKGKILSVKDTQINVQLADNVQGRIDVSELFDSWEEIKDRKRPLVSYRAKDVIDVRILGVHDAKNHRFLPITHRAGRIPTFELSAKPSDQTDAALEILSLDKVRLGSSWISYINNIGDDCIWVNISPNVRGRLRHLDVSDDISLLKDVDLNFPVGSALRVHVTGVDLATNRLDLSARSKPLTGAEGFHGLSKGMVIPGRVTKVQERQISVQLSETTSGTVGLTDLVDDYSKANPTVYAKNEIIRVCVTELDVPHKRVSLSTRPSRVLNSSLPVLDREISSIGQLRVGAVVRGFIKNVADNGVFVSLGPHVTAYVRVSDLSDAFVKDWKTQFHVDQLVKGKVIAVDVHLNHVQLSLKSSVVDQNYVPPVTFHDMKAGQIVTGKVRKVEDFGVFIVVDGSANVSGLCHRSEIADERVQDVRTIYDEGDVVKAKVLKVDPEKRRISFGLKMSYFEQDDDDEGDEDDEDVEDDEDDEDDEDEAMAAVDMADSEADEEDDEDDSDGGVDLDNVKDFDSDAEEDVPSTPAKSTLATNSLKDSTSGLATSGFDWTASILDDTAQRQQRDSSPSDSDTPTTKRKKPRRKPSIQADLTGDLDAHGPQSSADYERLLLSQPSSSSLWLQYMAFQLQLGEVDAARQTAERALGTIDMREETEKLNVWIAMLNLENTYGTDDTVDAVFPRACAHNDPQEVHERLTSIYIQSGKHDQATALFRQMTKKFSASPAIWLNNATYLSTTLGQPAAARALLPRALQALPAHTHVATTSKFGALEYRSPSGDPERGRTVFEGLLATFPKRWDLWGVLLELEMGRPKLEQSNEEAGTEAVEGVRRLFRRVLGSKGLKDKTARSFFRRWVGFEERLGGRGQVEEVKRRAGEWVRKRGVKEGEEPVEG